MKKATQFDLRLCVGALNRPHVPGAPISGRFRVSPQIIRRGGGVLRSFVTCSCFDTGIPFRFSLGKGQQWRALAPLKYAPAQEARP